MHLNERDEITQLEDILRNWLCPRGWYECTYSKRKQLKNEKSLVSVHNSSFDFHKTKGTHKNNHMNILSFNSFSIGQIYMNVCGGLFSVYYNSLLCMLFVVVGCVCVLYALCIDFDLDSGCVFQWIGFYCTISVFEVRNISVCPLYMSKCSTLG